MKNQTIDEEAYLRYFGLQDKGESTAPKSRNPRDKVYADDKAARVHTMETLKNVNGAEPISYQHVADDNIDDVEMFADILKRLCNAAWGDDWGELSPDLKHGEDSSNVLMPQITVEINTRDWAEGMGSPKPILVDIVKEKDGSGKETGDAFLVYRQWYNCNMEFNFYGRTNKEARQIQKRFETLLAVYTGYLKRNGISEIVFQQEVSPKCSLNYNENQPMRCVYYFVRFENITVVRQSVINNINLKVGLKEINTDKVRAIIDNQEKTDIIDFDFYTGDNEITYNNEF